MRCVLITAFGSSVEPDVNMNFAMVSGETARNARSTAAERRCVVSNVNDDAPSAGGCSLPTTSSAS